MSADNIAVIADVEAEDRMVAAERRLRIPQMPRYKIDERNWDEGQLGESVQWMRLRSSYIVLAITWNWPQIDNGLVLKRKKTKDHRGQNRRRGWSRSIIDQHRLFTPVNNDQVPD